MLNLNDLQVKRGQVLTQANALITGKNITSETRAQFDKLIEEANGYEQDIARLEQVAEFEAETRSSSKPPRNQPGQEQQEATPERIENEKRAFAQWFKTGHVSDENRAYLRSAETRDVGAGAVAGAITQSGAFLVPTGFYPSVISAKKSYGAILASLDSLQTDHGNPIRIPLSNDTANGLTVIGEAVAASETEPSLSGVTSNTDFVSTGIVKVSLSLISQSGFDLESFLTQQLYQRYYRGLSQLVTIGSTSGNVASFTAIATTAVTTAAPTAIAYSELAALYGALDPAYVEASSFYLTSSTRAYLMGLTSTTGQPLIGNGPDGAPFSSLFGRPIVISQFTDQIAATKSPILFGSGVDSYTVREATGGLSVSILRERFMDTAEIGVVGYGLVGGFSKAVSGSAPLVKLVQHA